MARVIQSGQQVKGSQIKQVDRKKAQKGKNIPKTAKGK
jgi:hypothetical protein